ncbi:FAD-dependent oxidoreductase [Pseudonocardia aurantiaca]|uniref:FAD-dependent oxidoreductase n=1 Tax=Pseudonocardia aurantiaca TaxID=75290 RepID=A0ABW4FNC9_9PSEU
MTAIAVLGAGLTGLTTAVLLARDGHHVTVLERDPAEPPATAEEQWAHWDRPGVSQFRLPHIMLARWRAVMEHEAPDVVAEVERLGGLRLSSVETLPTSVTGGLRPGDEQLQGMAARRPVVEGALAAVAARTPRLTVRRGVTATALVTDGRGAVPHVTGVVTGAGETVEAGLVVDAMGRRSALADLLARAGARQPLEEREDHGFAYYGRYFRTPDGARPPVSYTFRHFESVSLLVIPADAGVWAWVLVVAADDRPVRALRENDVWDRVLALMPGTAEARASGVPMTDVQVMSGLQDRRRSLVVEGEPVATGVVAVGDAWASTNPSLGRGSTMGLAHACILRDVLRAAGSAAPGEFARCFAEATASGIGGLFEATRGYDRHRLAEVAADIAGVPYRPEGDAWPRLSAFDAAAQVDPDALRAFRLVAELLASAEEALAVPGLEAKIARIGGSTPRYPVDGPSRAALLAALGE